MRGVRDAGRAGRTQHLARLEPHAVVGGVEHRPRRPVDGHVLAPDGEARDVRPGEVLVRWAVVVHRDPGNTVI